MSSHATTFPVARKPHSCLWCKERIDRGECYALAEWAAGNEHGRGRYHAECYAAMRSDQEFTDWWFGESCIPACERGKAMEQGWE